MASVDHVLKVTAKNKRNRWSYNQEEKNISDSEIALNRMKNERINIEHVPKFTFNNKDKIFTLGSCFAREIESILISKNFLVNSRPVNLIENNPLFEKKNGVSPYDMFNRYNLGSMYQEVFSLLSRDGIHNTDSLIYTGQNSNLYDDLHYTPALASGNISNIKERRKLLYEHLSSSLNDANVVIITLGLCEAWFDTVDDKYLNVISSPQMLKRYKEQLDFRFINLNDNLNYLNKIIDLMPRKKIILTVSPVPLQVTFTGKDIVMANTEAKSVLRSVASEVVRNYTNVDYFPSYEFVTHTERNLVWKSDGLHIQYEMVEHIVNQAINSYMNKFK